MSVDAPKLTDAVTDDNPSKLTEADLLAMLRAKLARPGNGGAGEYAVMAHVRDAAGFDAGRTFDAVAVSLWPSRGFLIDCYEIKCSRSDWLRELKDPAKAEAAARRCDRFSIVAANASIVASGELPPTWGLLVATANGLRTVKPAPLLPGADPERPVDRSFLVPLLRSAGAVAALPKEIADARRAGYEEGTQAAEAARRWEREQAEETATNVRAFEEAAGVKLGRWTRQEDAARVGRALRAVLGSDGAEQKAVSKLTAVRSQLADALAAIDKALTP